VDAGVYGRSRPHLGYRAGDPRRFILGHNQRGKSGPRGSSNGRWRGQSVTYKTVHDWVRRRRPATGVCQRCRATDCRTENANLSGEYRRDLSDFTELCVTCHRNLDAGNLDEWKETLAAAS